MLWGDPFASLDVGVRFSAEQMYKEGFQMVICLVGEKAEIRAAPPALRNRASCNACKHTLAKAIKH